MKKWLKICFSCVLSSLVLLGAVSLLCLTSSAASNTFTISWLDDLTFIIPYDSQIDHYHVWYSLDSGASWTGWLSIDNEDFNLAQRDYYPVLVLDAYEVQYYVSAENASNPDSIYVSNTLTRSRALFSLVQEQSFGLMWDNVPNVQSYQVQRLNGSTWVTIQSFNRTINFYTPLESMSGDKFRVRALLADGSFWYSNTCIWYYLGVTPDTYDMAVVTTRPAPYTDGGNWTITTYPEKYLVPGMVANANDVLTAGIYNSKLGPYVMIAFSLMGSFAILGYFAFRMH